MFAGSSEETLKYWLYLFYLIRTNVEQSAKSEMKNATCDPEEHQRIMNKWDEDIKEANSLTSHLPDQHGNVGIQFPAESDACVSQYGNMYAEKYEQLTDIVSDKHQRSDRTRVKRWGWHVAAVFCRLCCYCCGMRGCGLCCGF